MTSKSKQFSVDQLAKMGIEAEVPEITVVEQQAIDTTVANTDLATLARDESFMAEIVRIRVATTTDPNAPPYATVTVNDVNNRVHLPRGVIVPVKRQHVEVLARMRETRFTQPQRNPMDPESGNYLIPHHATVYPFEVIEDRNPRGAAWLEALRNEPTY